MSGDSSGHLLLRFTSISLGIRKNEKERAQPGARANGRSRPWLILNVRQKMKALSLFLASGQFILPVLYVGFPAALAAMICFGVALILKRKNREVNVQRVLTIPRVLNIAGGVLLAVAFFSPAFERFVS